MNALPLEFLMLIFAGGVNRHQQDVIEYVQGENRALLRLTTFWSAAVAIATPPNSPPQRIHRISHGSIFLHSFLASSLAGVVKVLGDFIALSMECRMRHHLVMRGDVKLDEATKSGEAVEFQDVATATPRVQKVLRRSRARRPTDLRRRRRTCSCGSPPARARDRWRRVRPSARDLRPGRGRNEGPRPFR